jgi:hypothetical protein
MTPPPLTCPHPEPLDCPLFRRRVSLAEGESLRRLILTERRRSPTLAALIEVEGQAAPPEAAPPPRALPPGSAPVPTFSSFNPKGEAHHAHRPDPLR